MIDIIYDNQLFKSTNIRNYYISENGQIGNVIFKNEEFQSIKLLKCETSKKGGYLRVPLKYEPNKEKKYLIHRLVYQAFVGE